jgi:hypothetical protein
MIAEHEKSGDTSTAIFKLLEGTEGTWVGNRFHPSKSAIDQTDFLHIFLFEAILKIAKFQREQYRKIPLQIGALARLKGKAAGKQEIRKLMGFLETRPDSRAYVVNALMESRLSPELYIRELRVTERGRVLDFALGL